MQNFCNLDKKGTVIISAGRAGSHLMADMMTIYLQKHSACNNLGEVFFNGTDIHTTKQLRAQLQTMEVTDSYKIFQVQHFATQIQILRFANEMFDNYHVVSLSRKNLMAQFFGLQILHNFYDITPVHTIKGVPDNFSALHNKKITVSKDSVYQFLAHLEIVKNCKSDLHISYEDFVATHDTSVSKYTKNHYPVTPQTLFENYQEVEDWLLGND